MARNADIKNTPFIVGVSGHRDLHPDGVSHLRGAASAFLHQLKQLLPDTELRIMVGMAEGADLLVAQAALELGLRVDAVLPMPLDQYATDFDPPTLALLKTLLQREDVRRIELSLPVGTDASADRGTVTQRDAMYVNLTENLIRGSSLLLALWDGQASPLRGGTADTVLRYLGIRTDEDKNEDGIGFVDSTTDLDLASRLVYWIPTTRSDQLPPPNVVKPCFLAAMGDLLQTQFAMPAHLRQRLVELNSYNREFSQLARDGHIGITDSLLAALPADTPLHDRPTLEMIDGQYGKADALAIHYQKRSDRLFKFFSLMTLVMGLAYLSYERITHDRSLLFVYLFILLSGLGVYYLFHGRRWFAKHLMCRALAETMRAMFYLRLAGADHLVDAEEVISLSGIDQFHGFSWIGYALKGAESPRTRTRAAPQPDTRQLDCVDRAWIEDQQTYFIAKVAKLERHSRRTTRLKKVLFGVILLVVLTLIMFDEFVHHTEVWPHLLLNNLLAFSMGMVAVLIGVWELHQTKMATRELLWQYRNQLIHFSRARTQFSRVKADDRRKEILAELGKDSLMESYLWTIHRYHREHEPPTSS